MELDLIKMLLVNHFYIGLPIIGLILVFLIKGKKRSRNVFIHFGRVVAEVSLVLLIKQYLLLLIKESKIKVFAAFDFNFFTTMIILIILLREGFLFLNQFEKFLIQKGKDVTSTKFLILSAKVSFLTLFCIAFGQHFGLSLSGLVAFGGVGGLAIGLAAKEIASNFFAGIMLYFKRSFNIGDWISSPDKQIEGIVQEIGWWETKILTFENRPLYVPNSIFTSIIVENPGQMNNRKIQTTIGVRYDDIDKIKIITQQVYDYLKNNPAIDQDQVVLVYFNEFGNSSLKILVWCYTKTTKWTEWLTIQQQVYLEIIDIVHKNGADFAWNTQLLYVQQNQQSNETSSQTPQTPNAPFK